MWLILYELHEIACKYKADPQKHRNETLSPNCKLLKGKDERVVVGQAQLTAESTRQGHVFRIIS